MDYHTFHMYSLGNGPKLDPNKLDASYLSPSSLGKCGDGVRALQRALPESKRGTLWAGETAAANDGGQTGITDTFIDGFWYLDQLGQLAALDVQVFCRQTMVNSGGYPLAEITQLSSPPSLSSSLASSPSSSPSSSSYSLTPLPDYYVALIHKRLMGTTVLDISSSSPNIRAYAHCAAGGTGKGVAGVAGVAGVTVALLNIDQTKSVSVTFPSALADKGWEKYILSAGDPIKDAKNPLQSRQVKLNGEVLSLGVGEDGGSPSLPVITGKAGTGNTLVLPPTTYGFVHFPQADVPACS